MALTDTEIRQAKVKDKPCRANDEIVFSRSIGLVPDHFAIFGNPGPSRLYAGPPFRVLPAQTNSMRKRDELQKMDSWNQSEDTPGLSESPRPCGFQPRADLQSR